MTKNSSIKVEKKAENFAIASAVLLNSQSTDGKTNYQAIKATALFIPDKKSKTYHHFTLSLEIWKSLDNKTQVKQIETKKVNNGNLTEIKFDKPIVVLNLQNFLNKCQNQIGKKFNEIDFIEESNFLADKVNTFINFYNNNKNNNKEEFWQKELEENSFIISIIFHSPYVFIKSKHYCGGKTIENKNGKNGDFLYQNQKTNSVAFIEIKTPKTKLVQDYRSASEISASKDLSGGISQVLNQKSNFQKDSQINKNFNFNNIKTILIIGDSSELDNDNKKECFESIRENSKNVEIITYDELFSKIESIYESFKNKLNNQKLINLS